VVTAAAEVLTLSACHIASTPLLPRAVDWALGPCMAVAPGAASELFFSLCSSADHSTGGGVLRSSAPALIRALVQLPPSPLRTERALVSDAQLYAAVTCVVRGVEDQALRDGLLVELLSHALGGGRGDDEVGRVSRLLRVHRVCWALTTRLNTRPLGPALQGTVARLCAFWSSEAVMALSLSSLGQCDLSLDYCPTRPDPGPHDRTSSGTDLSVGGALEYLHSFRVWFSGISLVLIRAARCSAKVGGCVQSQGGQGVEGLWTALVRLDLHLFPSVFIHLLHSF
jgi:hypothetical protein